MKFKNIKLFIYLFLITPVITNAEKVCDNNKYSIVFINGMLNTRTESENSRASLERLLELNGFNLSSSGNIVVRKSYNPKHIGGFGDGLKVLLQKGIDENDGTAKLDFDAKQMLRSLHDEVKEGKILFVPHSQGNFYANTFYRYIGSSKDGLPYQSMTMYNVASPSKISAYNSKYLLSKSDKVISGLVGSIFQIADPNVDYPIKDESDNGHSFVNTYIAQGGDRMVSDIKAQLELLKSDKNRPENIPCIPDPSTGLLFNIQKGLYYIVDPIASITLDTVGSIVNISKNGLAQVFIPDDKNTIKTDKTINISASEERVEEKSIDKPIAENSYPAKTNFSENISEPKNIFFPVLPEVENKKSDSSTNTLSLIEEIFITHKGHGSNLAPQTIKDTPTIIENNSSSSNPVNESSTTTASTTPVIEDVGAATSTSSTTPEVINSILKTDFMIDDVIGRERLTDLKPPIYVNIPNVIISEYFIGKDGDASWFEISNVSDDLKYVDMRDVYLYENGTRVQFPVNVIPPKKTVILRTQGNIIHSYSSTTEDSLFGIYNILNNSKENGTLEMYSENWHGREFISGVNFGNTNCELSQYRYNRSCEVINAGIQTIEGKEWYLSQNPEKESDRENDSSFGSYNHLWKYDYLNGDYILGDSKNLIREDRVRNSYFSGESNVPPNYFSSLGDYNNWKLVKSDEEYFGNGPKSKILLNNTTFIDGGVTSSPTPSVEQIGSNIRYIYDDNLGNDFVLSSTTAIGIDENNCFNGKYSDARTNVEKMAICGNGWSKRNIAKIYSEKSKIKRDPTSGRLKISAFNIGKDGYSSWIKVTNTTKDSDLYLNNTDIEYNGNIRVPLPNTIVLKNSSLIISMPGLQMSGVKYSTNYSGRENNLIITGNEEVMPTYLNKEGEISILYAHNPFSKIEKIDSVAYSENICPGTITQSGVCEVNINTLKFNDISDGLI